MPASPFLILIFFIFIVVLARRLRSIVASGLPGDQFLFGFLFLFPESLIIALIGGIILSFPRFILFLKFFIFTTLLFLRLGVVGFLLLGGRSFVEEGLAGFDGEVAG